MHHSGLGIKITDAACLEPIKDAFARMAAALRR